MDHLPLSDIPMLVSTINFLLRDEIFDNGWKEANAFVDGSKMRVGRIMHELSSFLLQIKK